MSGFTVTSGRVVTPDGILDDGWVSVADGVITAVGSGAAPAGETVDVGGGWIVPGFVDIHCHGGGGAEFGVGDTLTAVRTHRAHGTTTMLASLMSGSIAK